MPLIQWLVSAGLPCIEFRQGYASMSPAIKEVERRVLARTLRHDGNPVLAWAIGNCHTVSDDAENVKLSKKRSHDKIDPAVCLVMATGLSLTHEAPRESVYTHRGILVY